MFEENENERSIPENPNDENDCKENRYDIGLGSLVIRDVGLEVRVEARVTPASISITTAVGQISK